MARDMRMLRVCDALRRHSLAVTSGNPTSIDHLKVTVASRVRARGGGDSQCKKRNRGGESRFVHRVGSGLEVDSFKDANRERVAGKFGGAVRLHAEKRNSNAMIALFRSVPSAE